MISWYWTIVLCWSSAAVGILIGYRMALIGHDCTDFQPTHSDIPREGDK